MAKSAPPTGRSCRRASVQPRVVGSGCRKASVQPSVVVSGCRKGNCKQSMVFENDFDSVPARLLGVPNADQDFLNQRICLDATQLPIMAHHRSASRNNMAQLAPPPVRLCSAARKPSLAIYL